MAVKSPLERILDKNHVELNQLRKASLGWFHGQVEGMRGIMSTRSPQNLMRGDQSRKTSKIVPGNMYMYIYDPKHKETLPYYDTFPLVFPFHEVKGGFYGINIHYLPYTLRAQLLSSLMELNTGMGTAGRQLNINWAKLSNISKHHLVKPCVKHYLYPHVMSPFKRIDQKDWATVMLLPAEKFEKQNMLQVWAESIKKIR